MIDPHVHLRDWNQSQKETVKHGLEVAYKIGLDAVFEMPNTDPPLTSLKKIKDRIKLADSAIKGLGIKIFHGLYGGITADTRQIKEIVEAHNTLFPRVVGLKMFAGHSTGNMGIIKEKEQKLVYKRLAELSYNGVLFVHCEKESFLKPKLWNPNQPITHTIARSPEAETESVKDQLNFAKEANFKGTLHICHISVPKSLKIIEGERNNVDFKITCGITPHHALLYDEMMDKENGILLKMNPPLRSKEMEEYMLNALMEERINWIESDHAPHTSKDKVELFASGIPGFYGYVKLINFLREKGLNENQINDLTHNNIVNVFNINISQTNQGQPNYDFTKEYEFNPFNY